MFSAKDKIIFWITVGLIAVIVCLLMYSISVTKQFNKEKAISNKLENTVSNMHQKINGYAVELNESTVRNAGKVKTLNYTIDNLKADYGTLLTAMKIKPSNVNNIANISSLIKDTVTVTALIDSFGGLKAVHKDKFAYISVDVTKDRKALFDYVIKDSLSVIISQKKHSLLFGLIKWNSFETADVVNYNPKATISDMQIINVFKK